MNGRYGHSTAPRPGPQVVEKRDPSVCCFVAGQSVSEYGQVMERRRQREREYDRTGRRLEGDGRDDTTIAVRII